MLITKSNLQDPSLFYPWNTVPLIFLPLLAILTLGETKSVNLFCSYIETTHADFSSKQKSADFLILYRELPSLPILSTEPLLFPIDSAVVFNK
jgi:hypothetical protein